MKIERFLPTQPDLAAKKQSEEVQFKKASKLYEQQFLREMVKAMRQTVKPSGLVKQNFAEKMFTEQLDGEYVQGWSERGGVGMADMIYSQLKERFGSQSVFAIPPSGPIPLETRGTGMRPIEKNSGFKILNSPQLPDSGQFIFQGPKQSFPVRAPWDAVVDQSFVHKSTDNDHSLELSRQVFSLNHHAGIRSKIVFEGSSLDLKPGDLVRGGDILGQARGGSGLISWKVTKKV